MPWICVLRKVDHLRFTKLYPVVVLLCVLDHCICNLLSCWPPRLILGSSVRIQVLSPTFQWVDHSFLMLLLYLGSASFLQFAQSGITGLHALLLSHVVFIFFPAWNGGHFPTTDQRVFPQPCKQVPNWQEVTVEQLLEIIQINSWP